MKSILTLVIVFIICNITFAQKNVTADTTLKKNPKTSISDKNTGKKDQVTPEVHISPGSSGVKRSIGYKFSSATGDDDPGSGIFRYDNNNVSEITALFVDILDISGEDQTNWYSTWDDTTGATGRGRITVADTEGKVITVLNVTNVFTDRKGFWKIPVEYVSGTLPAEGSVYYYVFERIAHGGAEDKDNQKVDIKEEKQENQKVEVTEEKQENQKVEVKEEKQENQKVEVTEEKKENQKVEVTEEKKENQKVEVKEEKQEIQKVEIKEEKQENQKVEVKEEKQEIQKVEVKEEKQEIQKVEVKEEKQEIQKVEVKEEKQEIQKVEVKEEKQEIQKVEVKEEKQEIQKVEVKEEKQEIQKVEVKEENRENEKIGGVEIREVKEEKNVVQEVMVSQGIQKTGETKINQIPQRVAVAPNNQRRQGGQISQTDPVQQPNQQVQPPKQTQVVQVPKTNPVQQQNQTTQVQKQTQVVQIPQTNPVKQPIQRTQPNQPAQNIQNNQISVNQTGQAAQSNPFPAVQNRFQTQGTTRGGWYRGIIEIGYALGLGNYGVDNFRFNFINGVRLGQFASIGLGIGYRRYFAVNTAAPYLSSGKNQIPVFLDFRTNFTSKKLTPYLAMGIGNSAGYGSSEAKPEGLLFNASGGLWYNISSRFAVFAGIGYEMQKLGFSDTDPFSSNYKKNANSLGINIGISF